MRLLINGAPAPSTINIKPGDGPITFSTTNDSGLVSSSWRLTFDPGFQYSERIGSLAASSVVFTATGSSVVYYLPSNAQGSWQSSQHAILIATPSDGSAARSLQITIG